jgi:hypothetical protein
MHYTLLPLRLLGHSMKLTPWYSNSTGVPPGTTHRRDALELQPRRNGTGLGAGDSSNAPWRLLSSW